jgi:hypothetical protein
MKIRTYFRRNIAITNEHGSWVFLLSPLIIGLFAGGTWKTPSLYLVIAALAGFLLRQPASIAIKAYSGRRPRSDLSAARFWILVYGFIGLVMVSGLVVQGYGYVLYLTIPGILVFFWHLWLISKRAERRQIGIEIVASGVLALSAPAAYWIGVGQPGKVGWWLWGLTWLQSAASIVYAYLRLEQHSWKEVPEIGLRLRSGRRAILYTTFNLVLVGILSIWGFLPPWMPLAYELQWLETLWGSLVRPAVGIKPAAIGFRQLMVSILFTIIFIFTW